MNEHLNIPIDIQNIINEIIKVDLNFVELPLPEHPSLSYFNRFIRVIDIDMKSSNQFMYFNYKQIIKDKNTGKELSISLPTPEWVIYKETWSFLRDDQNKLIELPLIQPNGLNQKDYVKVPSYKYMMWLMKNNKSRFLQIVETCLDAFIKEKQAELDQV